jgi:hypothetical protein
MYVGSHRVKVERSAPFVDTTIHPLVGEERGSVMNVMNAMMLKIV